MASSDQTFDLPDDMANRMSLFYANPTPILHGLAGATSQLLKEVSNTSPFHCLFVSFVIIFAAPPHPLCFIIIFLF